MFVNFASQQSSDITDTSVGSTASSISVNMGNSQRISISKITKEMQHIQDKSVTTSKCYTNMGYANTSTVNLENSGIDSKQIADLIVTRHVPDSSTSQTNDESNSPISSDRSDKVRTKTHALLDSETNNNTIANIDIKPSSVKNSQKQLSCVVHVSSSTQERQSKTSQAPKNSNENQQQMKNVQPTGHRCHKHRDLNSMNISGSKSVFNPQQLTKNINESMNDAVQDTPNNIAGPLRSSQNKQYHQGSSNVAMQLDYDGINRIQQYERIQQNQMSNCVLQNTMTRPQHSNMGPCVNYGGIYTIPPVYSMDPRLAEPAPRGIRSNQHQLATMSPRQPDQMSYINIANQQQQQHRLAPRRNVVQQPRQQQQRPGNDSRNTRF